MTDTQDATYTVDEVARMLKYSRRSVIRIFEKEPGVIAMYRPETLHKRRYRTLRIPREVYERVIRGRGRGRVIVQFSKRRRPR
jgi:hypothetical protein